LSLPQTGPLLVVWTLHLSGREKERDGWMERKGLVGKGGLGCCILGHLKVNSAKKKNPALKAHYIYNISP